MSPDEHSQEKKSKSQRKREMLALQDLGEQLVKLPSHQLLKLPLSNELLQAIKEAQSIKAHGALRRQLQYIGRLMREVDPEPILNAYENLQHQHLQLTKAHHDLENLRDRLLNEDNAALNEILTEYPDVDRQHLQQLIYQAQEEFRLQKPPKSARNLFRYLRNLKEGKST